MSKDDIAIVVDDNDNIISYKKSGDIGDERIRITSIWIENSKGQVLLAQRHRSKWIHPLKWGPACAGTVEKGETYQENAIKELHEEIGINNLPLKELTKEFYGFETGQRACMWYKVNLDWPVEKFILQADEVEQIKWVDKTWLARDLKENPDNYVPSAQMWPKLFRLY